MDTLEVITGKGGMLTNALVNVIAKDRARQERTVRCGRVRHVCRGRRRDPAIESQTRRVEAEVGVVALARSRRKLFHKHGNPSPRTPEEIRLPSRFGSNLSGANRDA